MLSMKRQGIRYDISACNPLTRIIHEAFTTAAYLGMSAAFRSLGLLDVLSSTPPGPSVASLASAPIYTPSLQTFMNNPG
ncbi:MAG: hypothetical protein JXR49_18810 [Acidobacteria bacterium]|nr:hypothetical protein [Acidobacteriota bacterium]